MAHLRSFHDDDSMRISDPAGVRGCIALRRERLGMYPHLLFPGVAEQSLRNHSVLGGFSAQIEGEKRRFKTLLTRPHNTLEWLASGIEHPNLIVHDDGHVVVFGRPARLVASRARIELRVEDEVVWMLREAWRDGENANKTQALIFVPDPEKWAPHLAWWLFPALYWHNCQWQVGHMKVLNDRDRKLID